MGWEPAAKIPSFFSSASTLVLTGRASKRASVIMNEARARLHQVSTLICILCTAFLSLFREGRKRPTFLREEGERSLG